MKVFENIVGKAENVGNQHLNLLYFPKYFLLAYLITSI